MKLNKQFSDAHWPLRNNDAPSLHDANVASIEPKAHGAKLPKLDVPTFDGNVLNWKYFWDQFRTDVAPAEKMVYLNKHALTDHA